MSTPHSASCTFSRRDFLKAAAIVTTAAGLPRIASAATTSSRRKVTVGAHPWVYAATQPMYDLTEVLPQVFADFSYAGVDGIELMHTAFNRADAVARIGELSAKHRLPVIGTSYNGAMWDRAQHSLVLENAERVLAALAAVGGRTLGTSVGNLRGADAKKLKTPDQLDAQAECLKQINALCLKHGVVLNLHNHTYEVENGLHDLKGTLERLPGTKLGPDLNWLERGGVNPAAFIRQYGRQIIFMHLRDQSRNGRWCEAMGEGDMDYAEIGRALNEIGFEGDAIIELAHEKDFQPTRPLRESFKISREFVRTRLGF